MIYINNKTNSSITIPVISSESLIFSFGHHLSGQMITLTLTPTAPSEANFYSCLVPLESFTYLGLYSFSAKDSSGELYAGLCNVIEEKEPVKTFHENNRKDYELFK